MNSIGFHERGAEEFEWRLRARFDRLVSRLCRPSRFGSLQILISWNRIRQRGLRACWLRVSA